MAGPRFRAHTLPLLPNEWMEIDNLHFPVLFLTLTAVRNPLRRLVPRTKRCTRIVGIILSYMGSQTLLHSY